MSASTADANPIPRELMLLLLSSLGVDMPKTTTISAAQLMLRLNKALDAAQFITDVFPDASNSQLVVNELPAWDKEAYGTLEAGVQRTTWKEVVGLETFDGQSAPPGADAYLGLRWMIGATAKEWDKGNTDVAFEDEDRVAVVVLKIIEIKRLNEHTPIIIVHYYRDQKDSSSAGAYPLFNTTAKPTIPSTSIFTVPQLSLALLYRILTMNSPRAPTSFKPNRSRHKRHLDPSFVLPMGTIEAALAGRLSKDYFCAVCGKKTMTMCHNCLIVPYCGDGCRKKDLAKHKLTCQDLSTVTWESCVMDTGGPHGGQIGRVINDRDAIQRANPSKARLFDPNVAAPNTHGDTPFVVKIQYNASQYLKVNDRSGELQIFFTRTDQTNGMFDKIVTVIHEEGYMAAKIYCWAKRTGDWELSLALEKLPSQHLPW